MTPTDNLKPFFTKNRLLGIWRLMRGYHLAYTVAALALGLSALANTLSFLLLQRFVDDLLTAPWTTHLLIALGFIGFALLRGGFTFVSGRLSAHTAESVVRRLRNYLYNHLQRLPFTYHDHNQTGELLQRATSDVDAIRRFFAEQAIEAGRILLLFIVNFLGILFLSAKLALLSIIIIPLTVLMSFFFSRWIEKRYSEHQEQEGKVSALAQENLSGIRVVKAFGRADYESTRFDRENYNLLKKGKLLITSHAVYWPVSDVLTGFQMLFGYFSGALLVINGEITVGTYLAYIGMLMLLLWPIRNIGRLVVQMTEGMVSYHRIATLVAEEEEAMLEDDVTPATVLSGAVTFDDVSFSYAAAPLTDAAKVTAQASADAGAPPRVPGKVLRNITLNVRPGEIIALVGATGSGKTSLVNLLPRFYDYTDGEIRLDGRPLTEYSKHVLRRQIGIVEQEPFLFSRSIRDNIALGVDRPVTDQEVEAAARAAALHDVVMTFPHGYDTIVGEKGVTLSGGQKQRVAIARTLLKAPRILILDDATSSVDTETEAQIRHALDTVMAGRTTFIIAHRIQTVMRADRIVVLDKGRIVQCGSHEELLALDGLYRQMYQLQAKIEEELQRELQEAAHVLRV